MKIEKHGEVFVLTMTEGENRWTTTIVGEFDQALDEIEQSKGPAALVTASVPVPAFHQTVMLARRWNGPDALAAGIVQQTTDVESNLMTAVERAQDLAHLAENQKIFSRMRELL